MSGRTWPKSRVREATCVRVYRTEALTEQSGRCAYCHAPITVRAATADHFVARHNGGTTTKENIKATCQDCNKLKGHKAASAFLNAIKHPEPGDRIEIWLAWSRRRIFLATERACSRIERAAK
jgi:5-methylcytosine-specific restriction endonuclease McrA